MKFCDTCKSYMNKTTKGFVCPQCGKQIQTKIIETIELNKDNQNTIHIVNGEKSRDRKVTQLCPQCQNSEAFYTVSSITGEHAGVKQERTLERFTCTQCGYSWTKR